MQLDPCGILVHSRPAYSAFLREVIRQAESDQAGISWSVASFSNSDRAHAGFVDQLGAGCCLDLQLELNRRMPTQRVDLSLLSKLPASVFQCLSSSKEMPGIQPLILRPREYQLRLLICTYLIYREFLEKVKPDFVFFPLIELYDSVLLYHLCDELGIEKIVYAHGRSLGVSYFSDDLHETVPKYALECPLEPQAVQRARQFIAVARGEMPVAGFVTPTIAAEDLLSAPAFVKRRLPSKVWSLILRRLARWLPIPGEVIEPHLVDRFTLWNHVRVHFMPLTIRWRAWKGRLDRRQYDILTPADLPQRYVYYPLQLTPEASINIPAPIFIDQIHAIDWILNGLPPDHYLVVKEHPAMRGCRPASFYRELRKRAAVLICDYAVPGQKVLERASLTISVTGTACLEAFLLGKPSMHIGFIAFTNWIRRGASPDELARQVRQAIADPSVPDQQVEDYVTRTFMVGGDFVLFSPDSPYLSHELLLNRPNVRSFLACLQRHLQRTQQYHRGQAT